MINNGNDIGFIHDIAGLDKLRQQAVKGDEASEKEALSAAAKQFEAIFTNMLFKSMRDANATFESGLMDSQNQQFYRQMLDDQMSSELSASGSLGLADMIVAQLSTGSIENQNANAHSDNFEQLMEKVDRARHAQAERELNGQLNAAPVQPQVADISPAQNQPNRFDTPESFVSSMKPYAEKAARALVWIRPCCWLKRHLKRAGGKKWLLIPEVVATTCLILKRIRVGLAIKLPLKPWNIIKACQSKKKQRFEPTKIMSRALTTMFVFLMKTHVTLWLFVMAAIMNSLFAASIKRVMQPTHNTPIKYCE
ncbi:flagellar protein FlgJ [Vibrio ponticus]|nr:flagellar protein FlgJ [Vibrio ponticus]